MKWRRNRWKRGDRVWVWIGEEVYDAIMLRKGILLCEVRLIKARTVLKVKYGNVAKVY